MAQNDGTVRGAVAQRRGQQDQQQQTREGIEKRILEAHKWFARVVPAHIDAEQYVALAVGSLRKNDQLAAAAIANPASLMVALSECARLGLIPGETYHFVPFRSEKTGVPEVTGIINYRGEVELMFRSGAVSSVHCEVVREHDEFTWRPNMILPEHVIHDDGLADDEARGPLRAVYAYARLTTGGVSQVIVMPKSEVMKHRKKAKTNAFWGPEWPKEDDWTPDMWRKTALHKLERWVPTSSEYVAERLRATAVTMAPAPELLGPGTSPLRGLPAAMPNLAAINGPDNGDESPAVATAGEGREEERAADGQDQPPPPAAPEPRKGRRQQSRPAGQSAGAAFDEAEPLGGSDG